jgi:response regulator of citrate/malate metabolism
MGESIFRLAGLILLDKYIGDNVGRELVFWIKSSIEISELGVSSA